MENYEDKKSGEEYLDLTKDFIKKEPPEIKPQISIPQQIPQREVISQPVISPPIIPQQIHSIIPPRIEAPIQSYPKKSNRKRGIFLFILLCLTLTSLGVSAYVAYDNHYLKSYLDNPEMIYSGDWDCFTEKCKEYMNLNEWSKDNCNSDLTECKINYQGQELTLPFNQINLPPEHELLCKEYICSTEIPIRRYLDD